MASPRENTRLDWRRPKCPFATIEKVSGHPWKKMVRTSLTSCERADIYSITLTTLTSLISKYSIDLKNIGRLEVGTETMLDKSKSVKSVLMQLFEKSGNFNVEGVDSYNAC